MLSYKRSVRVGELIHQEISKIILELQDPKIGFVTITGVKIDDDLRLAKVYYSVLGDENAKKAANETITKAAPFIRYTLGQRIELRYVPVLEFHNDTTPEKAQRVFELLKQIEQRRQQEKTRVVSKRAKKRKVVKKKRAIKKKRK
ncbi:MAG: 30S ribosome-binding factor RbfA [bacterium]